MYVLIDSFDQESFRAAIRSRRDYNLCASYFKEYGIQLPAAQEVQVGDDYKLALRGAVDCFIGAVIFLKHQEHQYFNNDKHFCTWSENALSAFDSVTDKKQVSKAEEQFKALQLEKNQELITVQAKLKALAEQLELNYNFAVFELLTKKSSSKEMYAQNRDLVEENNKLYKEITEAARKKADEYNSSAVKAITLSISLSYLKNNDAALVLEAENAYDKHLAASTSGAVSIAKKVVQLPESNAVYPFLEPKVEFPFIHEEYSWLRASGRHTIREDEINKLQEKVTRLIHNYKKSEESYSGILRFFVTIKNFFAEIFTKIIEKLTGATNSNNPVEQHSDLAQNVQNLVNGIDVNDRAKLIHRFNSQPSPLAAVIYDKNLTDSEKEDLLAKLAQAKPYRFKHEQPEARKNISIPSQSLSSSPYDPEGNVLLHAVKHGTPAMLRILLQQPDIDMNTKGCCHANEITSKKIGNDGVTALHIAVVQGDVEKVKLLIEGGADVNATNDKGHTSLHAVSDPAIMKLLIAAGAKINCKDKLDQTPLHLAASRGDVAVVEMLVKQLGIEFDAKDKLGNTPLHAAAAKNFEMPYYGSHSFSVSKDNAKTERGCNLAIMSALVNAGAEVNSVNANGYSPLHLSVLGGYSVFDRCDYSYTSRDRSKLDYQHILKQAQLLCDKGADVNNVASVVSVVSKKDDPYGNNFHPAPQTTPLLALYLPKKGLFCFSADQYKQEEKLASERLNVAKYLIGKGAKYEQLRYENDVSMEIEKGDTLLHRCAKFSDAEGIRYFSSLGLDINDQASPTHDTPLHSFLRFNARDYQNCHSLNKACAEAILQAKVEPTKTKIVTVEVSENTLNCKSSFALSKPVKAAILNSDNVFSQKAKAMGLVVNSDNCEDILGQVYQECGRGHRKLQVPLTAMELAYFTVWNAQPSTAIIDMFKKEQPSAQHIATMSK